MSEPYVDALEVLRDNWGYKTFRPLQAEIIASVLAGHDTLGLLPTGGGKSLTFQVPALMLSGLTLVVTPLISLMKDQVDNLRAHHIPAYYLHAALTRREMMLALDKCRLGKAKILYLSPEKLQSRNFTAQLQHLPVGLIVVDEAHCISQWGYDFRPSYLKISELRLIFPKAPVLALTASATPLVAQDICKQLQFRADARQFRRTFARPNISYVVRHADYKEGELVHILKATEGTAIVYTRSRKRTRQIADYLRQEGVSAEFYHAGLSPQEKELRQNRWKSGDTRVIVATTAFGMGIDKPDVRLVVHTDLPSSLEEYYQEAGRAGRDGEPAYAVVLVARYDRGTLTRRVADTFPDKDYIRQVYEKTCVFLGVAMGEGYQQTLEFSLPQLCQRYSLPLTQTDSALRLLSQAGYIDYTEEVSSRSRLMMLMERTALYDLRLDTVADRVLQKILRTYTGIFADYEPISEPTLASALGLTEKEVYEALLLLSRMHVLHYIPRSNTPYIYFPLRRQPTDTLIFPREVYEYRRRQMEERIEAMKKFVYAREGCRVQHMLRYFGEDNAEPCGTCDLCRAANARASAIAVLEPLAPSGSGFSPEATVLYLAGQQRSGRTPLEIASRSGLPLAKVVEVARLMLDDGRLTLLDDGALWARPGSFTNA